MNKESRNVNIIIPATKEGDLTRHDGEVRLTNVSFEDMLKIMNYAFNDGYNVLIKLSNRE